MGKIDKRVNLPSEKAVNLRSWVLGRLVEKSGEEERRRENRKQLFLMHQEGV
ncbi:MAG: hypothetical protein JSW59_11665 [Phycisphaerales bacterium]|nr:MAG: hypothetical protein JSW59_11665 [Phycisphaerales bacterium]